MIIHILYHNRNTTFKIVLNILLAHAISNPGRNSVHPQQELQESSDTRESPLSQSFVVEVPRTQIPKNVVLVPMGVTLEFLLGLCQTNILCAKANRVGDIVTEDGGIS